MSRPGPAEPSYRVRGILGKGAEAVVYQAQRARDGSEVALKCIQAPAGVLSPAQERAWQQGRRRLRHEMAMARSVDHPNVVKMIEYQEDPQGARLAMELVRGSSLRYYILDRPALVADLFVQVCAGIGALHAAGVAHRDVKPGNIMVENRKEILRPVLVDFGLAKASTKEDGSVSRAGTFEIPQPEYRLLSAIADAGGGAIVAISSILARLGVPGYTGYCASKAGLCGLVRALAQPLDGPFRGACARRQFGRADLAGGIGDRQVRNRGTIGGAVAHADAAADYPAALLAQGGITQLLGPPAMYSRLLAHLAGPGAPAPRRAPTRARQSGVP